jgi:DNA repair protein RecO (recombination protein O)
VPLYKEQGVVLSRIKLGEADRIVTILTQGSGKIRAVAKGIRRTKSKFGARLEPFNHVSLMLYRGRGALDTVAQAEIISSFRPLRDDLDLLTAGEAMLESTDKVTEDHERNVRLFMLLLSGLRALELRPADPAAVAESYLLKLLSLSGFHPSLMACAVCGRLGPTLFAAGQGGAVCEDCAEYGAGPVSPESLQLLHHLASAKIEHAGDVVLGGDTRREARAMLYGFTEYHLDRRIRSLPMLARSGSPQPAQVALPDVEPDPVP